MIDGSRVGSDEPKITFGSFLQTRRTELGKTQREMGCLSSAHLSQIESGNIQKVNSTTLITLARSYGFSLSELIAKVDISEDLVREARAVVVGEAVMALPMIDRQPIIETLPVEDIY